MRLITKFTHQTGRYMIHCHNLPHEDHDMMTQFRVGTDTPENDPMSAAPAGPMGAGDTATAIPVAGTPTTTTPPAPTPVPTATSTTGRPPRPPPPADGVGADG